MAKINRYELVTRHNPILTKADNCSPLSVGNGNFAYTADITGMQTLYKEYEKAVPLCSMAQWGWHTTPVSSEVYSYDLGDVEMTDYPYEGRTVRYAVEKKAGNEKVYDWVRENPHKLNLARVGLVFGDNPVAESQIGDIFQELKLYEGILDSKFQLEGQDCHVVTASDSETDTVAFRIESQALKAGLAVEISFPYGSHEISASNWDMESAHTTEVAYQDSDYVVLKRTLDRDIYDVTISLENCKVTFCKTHCFRITSVGSGEMGFAVNFSKGIGEDKSRDKIGDSYSCSAGDSRDEEGSRHRIGAAVGTEKVFENSRNYWKRFWNEGGVIDLHKSKDQRALELERRIILSQYLLAIQSAGSMPPQETGLTCNSWYGKAHLEMHLWHAAYMPLWNQTKLLERSFSWYIEHLPQAKENAERNGYKGARWPKMVAESGIDCPSPIATLLIWQQPHIIYMLELAYQNKGDLGFLQKYYSLVEETAEFMVDFAVYNEDRNVYELLGPVIPAQENHDPMVVKNPAFEVEYWNLALGIAVEWAQRCGLEAPAKWKEVAEHMAAMAVADDCYLAHDNCPDTYGEFATDHPSMLCSYGLIDSGRTDRHIMENSLKKVVETWDFSTMWGWDFAVMAMTAVRLGNPEYAIELLLMDTWKNRYVTSGNNLQEGRADLPLYLPGNGSLLLAAALMTAGYPGSRDMPGFPENGQWEVAYEGIGAFPY